MEHRYSRNRIYLTEEEQKLIKNIPILLGGAGIGSVIAECLLRFGFETITIVDGDAVELSNLNRQNYEEKHILTPKVEALKERLVSINRNAKITVHNCFITPENIYSFITGHRVAINALDFSSDVPLLFDKICQEHSIPVLHPYNLGWGALMLVISENIGLDSLQETGQQFNELSVVQYVSNCLKRTGNPQEWLDRTIERYKLENGQSPPPQLAIASWLVAANCTQIIFDIITGRPFKKFPEFYLSTIKDVF